MSQLSSVEPLSKSSPIGTLNPTLQAVLSSLDVHLEEELIRYRRQQPGKKVLYTNNGSRRPHADKPLEMISIKATGGRTQVEVPHAAPVTPNNGTFGETQVRNPQHDIPEAYATGNPFTTNGSQGFHPNYVEAAAPTTTQMQPDDYLESSEALLKNLAEEEIEDDVTPAEPETRSDGLLSPLGIGSMLLLLLASATFGYVAMNPASVSHLNRLFGSRTSKSAENSSKTAATSRNATEARGIPNSPNLASQEFEQLTLRSLSTVKPRVDATNLPSAAPRPQLPVNSPAPLPGPATGVPLDLSRTLLPQPLQSGTVPLPIQPVAPTTTPTPAPARNNNQSAAATRSSAAQENRYLVVMAYNGDRSLAQARRVAANAYVRRLPVGSRIQIAAFPSASEARQKVQQLQKQGLSAQVYRRPG